MRHSRKPGYAPASGCTCRAARLHQDHRRISGRPTRGSRTIVLPRRTLVLGPETLSNLTLATRNWLDLGHEVLVRPTRNVEWKLVEPAVAAHVHPTISFH